MSDAQKLVTALRLVRAKIATEHALPDTCRTMSYREGFGKGYRRALGDVLKLLDEQIALIEGGSNP